MIPRHDDLHDRGSHDARIPTACYPGVGQIIDITWCHSRFSGRLGLDDQQSDSMNAARYSIDTRRRAILRPASRQRLLNDLWVQWRLDVSDLFKPVPWTVQNLVAAVQSGALRLPDIQRPFVWERVKVRDFVDSLYRGYPVGELMFWRSPGDEDAHAIGVDAKTQSATAKIVDGQQRLTSLYAVMTGEPVVDDDYRREPIQIAFNPFIERFEVLGAALRQSPEWVPDIAAVFDNPFKARKSFIERYAQAHGDGEADEEFLEEVFARLHDLRKYSFTVIELQPDVPPETVADVFVRINSEGVNLTQADFILTWLSVFWDEGREELERFSRHSRLTPDAVLEREGKAVSWTPKNHYISPDPGRMLRAVVALGQRRGRLRNAYSALRGRDPRTGEINEARRDSELALLKAAQREALKSTNWDDFLRVLGRAGFRSKKMITSDNTVIYTYALWLIGLTQFHVDRTRLRDLMARWFFMSQTTGRYTNSPETRIEEDLARFGDAEPGNPTSFITIAEHVINTVLTSDFWSIRLPDDFITSSTAASPAYQAYLAALNILDADLFLLDEKVRDWMDPSAATQRDIEGHHLFPRAYLRGLGIADTKRINQVANYAPTDWVTNQKISDRPPDEYWPDLLAARVIGDEALERQRYWHALPTNWESMEYGTFLHHRRREMARVVRDGFNRLSDRAYQPRVEGVAPEAHDEEAVEHVSLSDLMNSGLISTGELLIPADPERDTIAELTEEGMIAVDDHAYASPHRAARADGDEHTDGWDYWVLAEHEPPRSLRSLAQEFTERRPEPAY